MCLTFWFSIQFPSVLFLDDLMKEYQFEYRTNLTFYFRHVITRVKMACVTMTHAMPLVSNDVRRKWNESKGRWAQSLTKIVTFWE